MYSPTIKYMLNTLLGNSRSECRYPWFLQACMVICLWRVKVPPGITVIITMIEESILDYQNDNKLLMFDYLTQYWTYYSKNNNLPQRTYNEDYEATLDDPNSVK